jgi:quercetin dioxygenase-like cupin family protein
MNARRSTVAALALLLAGTVYVSSAGATPGVNAPTPTEPPVAGVLVGSAERPLRVAQDGVTLLTRDETTVSTFELVYQPGASSGWHSHPGIVIAVVESGVVERSTVDRAGRCTTETFVAGDAFTEVGPHFVENPSADATATLKITRIFPTDQTTGRIDEPAPTCRS